MRNHGKPHVLATLWGLMVIALALGVTHAEPAVFDTLGGPLPRLVKAGVRPYLVVSDIEVPAGRMVTIEPGAVFLFKNFTGFHIQGRLVAQGNRLKPIVFTSEFDSRYNSASTLSANPYDWNGVYLHSDALGSTLAHTQILYSVYGLISETKFIRIEQGVFRDNGKSDVVIEKVAAMVSGQSYSYILSTTDATVDGVPVRLLRDPMAPRRAAYRYAGLLMFLAGTGVGVWQINEYRGAQKHLSELSQESFGNLFPHENIDWLKARDRRNFTIAGAGGGALLAVVGAVGFFWSFTF